MPESIKLVYENEIFRLRKMMSVLVLFGVKQKRKKDQRFSLKRQELVINKLIVF